MCDDPHCSLGTLLSFSEDDFSNSEEDFSGQLEKMGDSLSNDDTLVC